MASSSPTMSFDQFAKTPFVCDIGEHKLLQITRFLRKDWKVWAAVEDKKRREDALSRFKGDKQEEAKFLAFYVIPPTSPGELRNRLATYEGQEYVVRHCLQKLKNPTGAPIFTEEQIDEFFEFNDQREIEVMAYELACFRPRSEPTEKKTTTTDVESNQQQSNDEEDLDDLGSIKLPTIKGAGESEQSPFNTIKGATA